MDYTLGEFYFIYFLITSIANAEHEGNMKFQKYEYCIFSFIFVCFYGYRISIIIIHYSICMFWFFSASADICNCEIKKLNLINFFSFLLF